MVVVLYKLTRAEVRRLFNEQGKAQSAGSVDYIHVTLQKALSQAVRDDLILRNVATGEARSSRQRSAEEAKAFPPLRLMRCSWPPEDSATRLCTS
jgi:hypothetical protein